jgi:hypothetical protein
MVYQVGCGFCGKHSCVVQSGYERQHPHIRHSVKQRNEISRNCPGEKSTDDPRHAPVIAKDGDEDRPLATEYPLQIHPRDYGCN